MGSHIVVEGVPGGTEAALLAVGVVGDDVDAGDVGHGVHRLYGLPNRTIPSWTGTTRKVLIPTLPEQSC